MVASLLGQVDEGGGEQRLHVLGLYGRAVMRAGVANRRGRRPFFPARVLQHSRWACHSARRQSTRGVGAPGQSRSPPPPRTCRRPARPAPGRSSSRSTEFPSGRGPYSASASSRQAVSPSARSPSLTHSCRSSGCACTRDTARPCTAFYKSPRTNTARPHLPESAGRRCRPRAQRADRGQVSRRVRRAVRNARRRRYAGILELRAGEHINPIHRKKIEPTGPPHSAGCYFR